MEEIWKPIKNYEKLYHISNLGRVKSLEKEWISGNNIKRHHPDIILKTVLHRGYKAITLSKNKKRKTVKIHRLVAQAFISNPENKPEVNHKNGIKTDNRVENLEYVTYKENMKHATVNGLRAKGNRNGNSKLKEKEIVEIKKMLKAGIKQNIIAKQFKVTTPVISYIKNNKWWKHIKEINNQLRIHDIEWRNKNG